MPRSERSPEPLPAGPAGAARPGGPAGPIRYAVVPAPWGPLHVAASDRAVVGLEVLSPTEAFRSRIARRTGRDVEPGAGPVLDAVVAELEAYLAGRLASFSSPVDLTGLGAWDVAVLGGVRRVARGAVTSYGRLARSIGRPGAARAAGGAVGRNPVGLLVPCHRVIAGDGTIGGYGGDWMGTRDQLLAIKRELLDLEGIELPARRFAD